ncbi:hypothetical protein [Pseudomonas sp. IT-P291]|uniref:hypothetical protein n=1 Tax=Pseudomonas sp. IT-P291 TaxID=3026448 RepID=UPI0039E0C6F0
MIDKLHRLTSEVYVSRGISGKQFHGSMASSPFTYDACGKRLPMCGGATHRAPSRRLGGFNDAVTLNAGSGSVGCVAEQPVIETEESEADSCADNQIVEQPVEFLSTQDNGFVREIGGGFKVLGL